MSNYYLDIETTGFDLKKDKIISIQYQKLDNLGKPLGKLVILKEWENSEEEIIKEFYKVLNISSAWDFIPILTNHIFDLRFLFEKFRKYKLEVPSLEDYLYSKPLVDIKYMLVMANNMSFKGASLDRMTNKKNKGAIVPELFEAKKYKDIEDYIVDETESFLEFFSKCMSRLPQIVKL